MVTISIICTPDGNEWGEYLAMKIQALGNVHKFILPDSDEVRWAEMNQDVICIILSPRMFESHKPFIQKAWLYLKEPIIVLCGVSQRDMNQAVCCRSLKKCKTLTTTTSAEFTATFCSAVKGKLGTKQEQSNSSYVTLIPDTIVQKANQSCVLMFPRAVPGEVEVIIKGSRRKLKAKQKDSKTYVFNVPDLAAGNHEVSIYACDILVPARLSLSVTSSKPSKCPCDYICQMLGSEELHSLDETLTNFMEKDHGSRMFYRNISKPNPDFPEFPTALHFAAKHGMYNVVQHFLGIPGAKDGITIKNNMDMDCIDMARGSRCCKTLVPYLEEESSENYYMDMTQNKTYMAIVS